MLQIMPGKEYVAAAGRRRDRASRSRRRPTTRSSTRSPAPSAQPGAVGAPGDRAAPYPPGMSPAGPAPRIVVTLMVAAEQSEPEIAARKNAPVPRRGRPPRGGRRCPLDATATPAERERGVRGDGRAAAERRRRRRPGPLRAGRATARASVEPRPRRARGGGVGGGRGARRCRCSGSAAGFQAMNVFAGGTLRQHVDGHAGPGWGHGDALTHPLRAVPGHAAHPDPVPDQRGRRRPHGEQLPPPGRARGGPRAGGSSRRRVSPSPAGELVEAFESTSGPFRMAVQCHPERTRVHAARVRAAVRVLRGRLPGAAASR